MNSTSIWAAINTTIYQWSAAIALFFNTYILLRNDRRSEKRNAATKDVITKVGEVVQKVEVQTNNLTEQLVKKTASESHAAGLEAGRKEGEAKAATL